MRLIGIVFVVIAFAVLVVGIAEYILEKEEEKDKSRLIGEVIKEIERRKGQ